MESPDILLARGSPQFLTTWGLPPWPLTASSLQVSTASRLVSETGFSVTAHIQVERITQHQEIRCGNHEGQLGVLSAATPHFFSLTESLEMGPLYATIQALCLASKKKK